MFLADRMPLAHPGEVAELAQFVKEKFGGDNPIGEMAEQNIKFLAEIWLLYLEAEDEDVDFIVDWLNRTEKIMDAVETEVFKKVKKENNNF